MPHIRSFIQAALLVGAVNLAVGQTNFTILRSFSTIADGKLPWCTLADGKDGKLYGTTIAGGISDSGTVFRINLDGSGFASLKCFTGPDGANPYSGLVLGAGGELFGTTAAGGASNLGTIFRLGEDGSDFRVLHSFTGGMAGIGLKAALIQGSDGALYGMGDFVSASNRGTIFRINPDGSDYSIIHTFAGSPDGQQPSGKLLEASDGRLYGTTYAGGLLIGTVFSVQKDGSGYWILHNFQQGDGLSPSAGLLEGSDGWLYGTASQGGTMFGGTVFRLNKDGSGYETLHNFPMQGGDSDPSSELLEGTDGALYGTTYFGAVYKLNKDGSGYALLQTLGSATPWGLSSTTNGVIYGETKRGGLLGVGSIFAVSSSPLPPRIDAMRASGGTNLLLCAATSGFEYNLLRSTNLEAWSVLSTIASTNGGFAFPDLNPPQPAVFYRLERR